MPHSYASFPLILRTNTIGILLVDFLYYYIHGAIVLNISYLRLKRLLLFLLKVLYYEYCLSHIGVCISSFVII